MNEQDIKSAVKTYVLTEFLPGEDPSALTDATQLITTGVLDSISVLKLVTFLESHFGITLSAHETDVEHLNTLPLIAALVKSKLA